MDIHDGSDENTEKVKDKNQQAMDKLVEIQAQIEDGIRAGIDFTNEQSLLWGAILMLEGGNPGYASELLDDCQDVVSKKQRRFNYLVNTIKKAKIAIDDAYEVGGDTEEAKLFLHEDQSCLENGEYKTGVQQVMRCLETAQDEIDKRDVGGPRDKHSIE